jgi:diadenosine tetraphosphate (Ap4A) HIT family hydrolase
MSEPQQSCQLCQTLESLGPESTIFDDGTWVAMSVADVPGWAMLAPREHIEGIHGLGDEHAAALGPLARRLGAAVSTATGADRVHVVFLGDNSPHFHLGLFPRQPGQSGLFDTSGMKVELGERRDAEAAQALTSEIRAALGTVV